MARQRMVTRTIELNNYEVMCLNTETAEVSINTYQLGTIASNADPLKILKNAHETETFKLVSISKHTYDTVLYGMAEEDFIKYAKVLPPRTVAE